MSLNKSKGNMYPWVTHTWNPIRGKCPHGCVYCFMKNRDVGPLRLEEKTLLDNLGRGRTIFVGSSTDMFAEAVPRDWIVRVLTTCKNFNNKYIFQTKNPGRFVRLLECIEFPDYTVLGTTIESNRSYGQEYYGPPPWARAATFENEKLYIFEKMVSIEPVMAFDLDIFLRWLRDIKPAFVSIGADSKGHKLPEPTMGELDMLVLGLRKFTQVKLKKNLSRILLRDIKEV